ncbi:hypothetical protein BH23GEM7_BH23GEM7_32850 [soil metagenome]
MLHPWLREQLLEILSALPAREGTPTEEEIRADWQSWQEGLSLRPTLPETLPRLRMLLVLDNLTGHKSSEFVLWCFAQGIALLYTPLGGSWMNMTESLQRIVARRALEGTHPKSAEQIITWLEAAVARVARTRRRTQIMEMAELVRYARQGLGDGAPNRVLSVGEDRHHRDREHLDNARKQGGQILGCRREQTPGQ